VETLFDLREFSEKRDCATCGTEFLPSQKPQRFCCPKCKRVFFQRKEAARIKARFEFTQNNQVPLPENLSELDKEAVRLHTDPTRKKRLGIRSIASLQDRSHTQVKRVLIEAGVYKPTPEQNRRARKGIGPHSKVRKREMSEERKKEWERKVGVCLEGLNRGIGVETTCHANGWTPAGIWFYLYRNNEYKEWKAAHPAKPANVKQYERGRAFNWRSKKYPTEDEFQNVIEQLLKDFQISFVREKKLLQSRSRMDFELNASTFLECKICTKSNIFARAIGQAFLARAEKKDVWFVIPDDISMRKDQLELLQEFQIPIFSETSFRQKLAGQEPVQVQTRITAGLSIS
jgi:predicted RNA-binding Zn-ribbon protein involved in translation (DUF1610 family)